MLTRGKFILTVMLMAAVLLLNWTPLAGAAVRGGFKQTLYLEVYLNSRLLTKLMRFQEVDGVIYINFKEMSQLLEEMPPEDSETNGSLQTMEYYYPAKFKYVESQQAIFIFGSGRLSIERRLAREAKYEGLGNNGIPEDLPIVEFEPGWFGKPSLDVSLSYVQDFYDDYSYSLNHSFKGGMEALSGTAFVFGRGVRRKEFSDIRFSWEKFDPGWFFKGGDVVAPTIELISNSESGRGLNFSTFPIYLSNQFSTDTLSGDLLDGWVVELYRGKTLLDFKTSDGSGRYFFRDIPLLFGENNITLKFYGPQGQVREEKQRIIIGRGMAPKGKLWTRLSFTDQGESLFGGRYSQLSPTVNGNRGTAEAFYGLFDKFTLTGSLSSIDTKTDEVIHYGKAGFRTSLLGSSVRFDVLMDDNDGYGLQASFLTKALGWGIQFDSVDLFDLSTDREPNLESRRKLRINQGFKGFYVELSGQQEVRPIGFDRYEYRAKLSGGIRGISLTHDTNAAFISQSNSDWVRSRFLASGRVNSEMYLRSYVDYEVHPELEVRSLGVTLDYAISDEFSLRTNVVKNMINNRDYTISQGVFWKGDYAGIGLTGNYNSDRGYQLQASLSFSLTPADDGSYQAQRNPSTSIGTVNVRVFLDHNQDGKYDRGVDELMRDVGIRGQKDLSGKNGTIAFKAVSYRLALLEIDEGTLPDPYMVTAPATGVWPRPTHINTLDMAIWETGDIEGIAKPGELVELIHDGKVVAHTFADYDGFFLFEKARFNSYVVRSGKKKQRVVLNREHILAQVTWADGAEVAMR